MIGQRIRQFREHGAAPGVAEQALAARFLPGELLALFNQQEPRDIVHSANTARWLLDRGNDDEALVQAALLHDIGKGAQRRRDRVAHVVVSGAGLGRIVAQEHSRFALRRALARTASHSDKGADQLANMGVNSRVVELVRLHHLQAGEDAMLKLLQEADSAT